jgi:hypothetical protein
MEAKIFILSFSVEMKKYKLQQSDICILFDYLYGYIW